MTRRRTMDRERALTIRGAYSAGVSSTTLAREFGHSTSMISAVITGRHATTEDLPDIARSKGPTPRPGPPCGTNAAYARHVVRGEPIDQACQVAHRAYARAREQDRAMAKARIEQARTVALEALRHRHAAEYAALYEAALREEHELAGGHRV